MRALVLGVVALLVLTTPGTAQQSGQDETTSQQAPTFRGGVDFVRVDMYVSRGGVPVTDLRAEEIEIREDGVLQEIETFEHVSVPSGGPEATRIQPNSIPASREMLDDPRARVFIVFVDTYHFEAQFAQQMQTPLRRFLEEALGPDDLVALVTPEMDVSSITFGRRTTVLSEFFNQIIEWMKRDISWYSFDDAEYLYRQCYVGPDEGIANAMIARLREKRTFDALESVVQFLGLARDERKIVLLPTMGWQLYGPDGRLADVDTGGGVPIAPIDRVTGGRGRDGREQITPMSRTKCEADRLALADLDNRDRLRDLAGMANRANVSFYPITPLRTAASGAPSASLEGQGELRGLAEDTDGMAIVNTNNIGPGIQRVIEDSSSYYLAGYRSSKSPDGRYRRIEVRVKRPGVEVRARRGYRALPAAEALAKATAPARSSLPRPDAAVVRAFDDVARANTPVPLRIRASAWPRAGDARGSALWVVGEIDAATRRDPEWRTGASAEVTVLGPGGQSRQTLDMTAGTFAFAADLGRSGSPLGAGEYEVRVSVRPANGGTPLAETVRIDIPAQPAPLGQPVLMRRMGTQPPVPTADPRFRRNERLRLEVPTASQGTAEAVVIDRAGQRTQVPAQVSTRDDPSGEFRWIVADVILAPFASGEYAVSVTQDGTTSITAFRVSQ